jgi:hypothetical protein
MTLGKKQQIIGALCILRQALKIREIEDAHNILIDGVMEYNDETYEEFLESMEDDLEHYITNLDDLIDYIRKC